MLDASYALVEMEYRQGRLIAEAEQHNLAQRVRRSQRARKAEQRRHAKAAGPGSRSRLVAAVIQLTPQSRRQEQGDSADRAA
jgi:hypothetical protein